MATLYFAYGSNMDVAAMRVRCPTARVVGRAILPRHRFVIMPESYANVVADPANDVQGLLWEAGEADMRALDDYEEVDAGLYTRIPLVVLCDAHRASPAIVYVGRGEGGRPERSYIEGVVAAARDVGLDAAYVARLAAFAPA